LLELRRARDECLALLDGFRAGRVVRKAPWSRSRVGRTSGSRRSSTGPGPRPASWRETCTTRTSSRETLDLDVIPVRMPGTPGLRRPTTKSRERGVRRARAALERRISSCCDRRRGARRTEAGHGGGRCSVFNKCDLERALSACGDPRRRDPRVRRSPAGARRAAGRDPPIPRGGVDRSIR